MKKSITPREILIIIALAVALFMWWNSSSDTSFRDANRILVHQRDSVNTLFEIATDSIGTLNDDIAVIDSAYARGEAKIITIQNEYETIEKDDEKVYLILDTLGRSARYSFLSATADSIWAY